MYDLSVGDIKGADVGEPFLDVNADDQASSLIADVDGFIVNVDSPVDLDYDGIRNAGNEIYNGLACNDATGTECVRNNVQLFHNAEFIFTGINPHNGASPALPTTIQLCVKRQAVDVALSMIRGRVSFALNQQIPLLRRGMLQTVWRSYGKLLRLLRLI